MAQEIEIKLQVTDQRALQRALQRLKAKPLVTGSPRVHELNVIFDTTDGSLAKRGQLLRIRTETTEPKGKPAQQAGVAGRVAGNSSTPSSPPTGSSAAATWVLRECLRHR